MKQAQRLERQRDIVRRDDMTELPASVHDQFRRIVRIQDDPDLW